MSPKTTLILAVLVDGAYVSFCRKNSHGDATTTMMLSAEHIPRHHTGIHWENQASSRLSAPPLVTWHPQRAMAPSLRHHPQLDPQVDLRRSGTMNRGLDAPPRPWYVPVSPWAGRSRLGVLMVLFWPLTTTYSMPITTPLTSLSPHPPSSSPHPHPPPKAAPMHPTRPGAMVHHRYNHHARGTGVAPFMTTLGAPAPPPSPPAHQPLPTYPQVIWPKTRC